MASDTKATIECIEFKDGNFYFGSYNIKGGTRCKNLKTPRTQGQT
jgi:hypothetical protein